MFACLPADLTIDAIVRELIMLKSRGAAARLSRLARAGCGGGRRNHRAVGRLLLAEPSIREIDLNPVVAYPRGEGAVALDALMLVDASAVS